MPGRGWRINQCAAEKIMKCEDNALLIGGEDGRYAVVEVHTDRPIREGIVHTIFIAEVDPRHDEHAILRQIYIVAQVTEKRALRVRIKGCTERLCCRMESVHFGRGVVADVGLIAAAPSHHDPARPVISSRAYVGNFLRTLKRRSVCAGVMEFTSLLCEAVGTTCAWCGRLVVIRGRRCGIAFSPTSRLQQSV